MKKRIKAILPGLLLALYRSLRSPGDVTSVIGFLFTSNPHASCLQRLVIVTQLYTISGAVNCPHTQYEVLSFIEAIHSVPEDVEGCVIEAGAYKGGSTAKFSIAAKLAGRQLVVFDSFQGLPEHNEPHEKNIFGGEVGEYFSPGSYCGALDEVKANVRRFGELESCEFVVGWFDDTMPTFSRPVVAVYLDVDLVSSTRTCLKYLYPLLVPGGVLYSQDGHLPLVIDAVDDDRFWEEEVNCPKPHIEGLSKQKLIKIVKPANIDAELVHLEDGHDVS